VDLYFCHRYDPDTPLEEVARAMDDLVHQGKVLYWGTSEWQASQIAQVAGVSRQYGLVPPSMEQPQYNLFHRRRFEDEIVPTCRELGMGLTTFSPLYQGILTGKYNQGIPEASRGSMADLTWMRDRITPERISMVRKLTEIAGELDLTTGQLAIAWILRRKEISSVITGATRLEQLDENLAAAEAVELLSNELLERIDTVFDYPTSESGH